MIAAFQARILEALEITDINQSTFYDTMLVVVGRGTSDAQANAEAAKLTRIVAENMGFGWSETFYSGVTFPSVGQGLEIITKLVKHSWLNIVRNIGMGSVRPIKK